MKIILYAFLYLSSHLLVGQTGFSIKINAVNCANSELEIFQFSGSESNNKLIGNPKFTLDTQVRNLNYKKNTEGLVLGIRFKGKPEMINIFVEKGDSLQIEVKNKLISTLVVKNSPINAQYIFYQSNENITKEEKLNLSNSLITQYPNSLAGLFFKLEKQRITKIPSTYEEAYQQRDHFFDGIDKKDKRLQVLPNTYSYYFRLINLLPIKNEYYEKGVDQLMEGLTDKDSNYAFNLSWVFKNINYFKYANLEESHVRIFNKYVATQNVMFENRSEYSTVAHYAKLAEKRPNGTKCPDFEMISTDSVSHKLSEIYLQKDFTLLLFYDPDCHHCRAAIDKFNSFFTNKPAYLTKITPLAIFNISHNSDKWLEFISNKKLNTNWVNLRSTDPNRQYVNDFETYFNPAFYLINKEGIIQTKSGDIDVIQRLVGL